MTYDYLFKIATAGDAQVGKSAFIHTIHNPLTYYPPEYNPTIGVDFYNKIYTDYGNAIVKLYTWDTAGGIQFRPIIKSYFRDIAGVLIFFDITNNTSFENVTKWLDIIHSNSVEQPMIKILIGTHVDKEQNRSVSFESATNFAEARNMKYFECGVQPGRPEYKSSIRKIEKHLLSTLWNNKETFTQGYKYMANLIARTKTRSAKQYSQKFFGICNKNSNKSGETGRANRRWFQIKNNKTVVPQCNTGVGSKRIDTNNNTNIIVRKTRCRKIIRCFHNILSKIKK
jgi:small GTP-binding protein